MSRRRRGLHITPGTPPDQRAAGKPITIDSSIEVMRRELTCGFCNDWLEDALTLRCQHHFCHKCMSSTMTVTCPRCSTPFWLNEAVRNHMLDRVTSVVKRMFALVEQEKRRWQALVRKERPDEPTRALFTVVERDEAADEDDTEDAAKHAATGKNTEESPEGWSVWLGPECEGTVGEWVDGTVASPDEHGCYRVEVGAVERVSPGGTAFGLDHVRMVEALRRHQEQLLARARAEQAERAREERERAERTEREREVARAAAAVEAAVQAEERQEDAEARARREQREGLVSVWERAWAWADVSSDDDDALDNGSSEDASDDDLPAQGRAKQVGVQLPTARANAIAPRTLSPSSGLPASPLSHQPLFTAPPSAATPLPLAPASPASSAPLSAAIPAASHSSPRAAMSGARTIVGAAAVPNKSPTTVLRVQALLWALAPLPTRLTALMLLATATDTTASAAMIEGSGSSFCRAHSTKPTTAPSSPSTSSALLPLLSARADHAAQPPSTPAGPPPSALLRASPSFMDAFSPAPQRAAALTPGSGAALPSAALDVHSPLFPSAPTQRLHARFTGLGRYSELVRAACKEAGLPVSGVPVRTASLSVDIGVSPAQAPPTPGSQRVEPHANGGGVHGAPDAATGTAGKRGARVGRSRPRRVDALADASDDDYSHSDTDGASDRDARAVEEPELEGEVCAVASHACVRVCVEGEVRVRVAAPEREEEGADAEGVWAQRRRREELEVALGWLQAQPEISRVDASDGARVGDGVGGDGTVRAAMTDSVEDVELAAMDSATHAAAAEHTDAAVNDTSRTTACGTGSGSVRVCVESSGAGWGGEVVVCGADAWPVVDADVVWVARAHRPPGAADSLSGDEFSGGDGVDTVAVEAATAVLVGAAARAAVREWRARSAWLLWREMEQARAARAVWAWGAWWGTDDENTAALWSDEDGNDSEADVTKREEVEKDGLHDTFVFAHTSTVHETSSLATSSALTPRPRCASCGRWCFRGLGDGLCACHVDAGLSHTRTTHRHTRPMLFTAPSPLPSQLSPLHLALHQYMHAPDLHAGSRTVPSFALLWARLTAQLAWVAAYMLAHPRHFTLQLASSRAAAAAKPLAAPLRQPATDPSCVSVALPVLSGLVSLLAPLHRPAPLDVYVCGGGTAASPLQGLACAQHAFALGGALARERVLAHQLACARARALLAVAATGDAAGHPTPLECPSSPTCHACATGAACLPVAERMAGGPLLSLYSQHAVTQALCAATKTALAGVAAAPGPPTSPLVPVCALPPDLHHPLALPAALSVASDQSVQSSPPFTSIASSSAASPSAAVAAVPAHSLPSTLDWALAEPVPLTHAPCPPACACGHQPPPHPALPTPPAALHEYLCRVAGVMLAHLSPHTLAALQRAMARSATPASELSHDNDSTSSALTPTREPAPTTPQPLLVWLQFPALTLSLPATAQPAMHAFAAMTALHRPSRIHADALIHIHTDAQEAEADDGEERERVQCDAADSSSGSVTILTDGSSSPASAAPSARRTCCPLTRTHACVPLMPHAHRDAQRPTQEQGHGPEQKPSPANAPAAAPTAAPTLYLALPLPPASPSEAAYTYLSSFVLPSQAHMHAPSLHPPLRRLRRARSHIPACPSSGSPAAFSAPWLMSLVAPNANLTLFSHTLATLRALAAGSPVLPPAAVADAAWAARTQQLLQRCSELTHAAHLAWEHTQPARPVIGRPARAPTPPSLLPLMSLLAASPAPRMPMLALLPSPLSLALPALSHLQLLNAALAHVLALPHALPPTLTPLLPLLPALPLAQPAVAFTGADTATVLSPGLLLPIALPALARAPLALFPLLACSVHVDRVTLLSLAPAFACERAAHVALHAPARATRTALVAALAASASTPRSTPTSLPLELPLLKLQLPHAPAAISVVGPTALLPTLSLPALLRALLLPTLPSSLFLSPAPALSSLFLAHSLAALAAIGAVPQSTLAQAPPLHASLAPPPLAAADACLSLLITHTRAHREAAGATDGDNAEMALPSRASDTTSRASACASMQPAYCMPPLAAAQHRTYSVRQSVRQSARAPRSWPAARARHTLAHAVSAAPLFRGCVFAFMGPRAQHDPPMQQLVALLLSLGATVLSHPHALTALTARAAPLPVPAAFPTHVSTPSQAQQAVLAAAESRQSRLWARERQMWGTDQGVLPFRVDGKPQAEGRATPHMGTNAGSGAGATETPRADDRMILCVGVGYGLHIGDAARQSVRLAAQEEQECRQLTTDAGVARTDVAGGEIDSPQRQVCLFSLFDGRAEEAEDEDAWAGVGAPASTSMLPNTTSGHAPLHTDCLEGLWRTVGVATVPANEPVSPPADPATAVEAPLIDGRWVHALAADAALAAFTAVSGATVLTPATYSNTDTDAQHWRVETTAPFADVPEGAHLLSPACVDEETRCWWTEPSSPITGATAPARASREVAPRATRVQSGWRLFLSVAHNMTLQHAKALRAAKARAQLSADNATPAQLPLPLHSWLHAPPAPLSRAALGLLDAAAASPESVSPLVLARLLVLAHAPRAPLALLDTRKPLLGTLLRFLFFLRARAAAETSVAGRPGAGLWSRGVATNDGQAVVVARSDAPAAAANSDASVAVSTPTPAGGVWSACWQEMRVGPFAPSLLLGAGIDAVESVYEDVSTNANDSDTSAVARQPPPLWPPMTCRYTNAREPRPLVCVLVSSHLAKMLSPSDLHQLLASPRVCVLQETYVVECAMQGRRLPVDAYLGKRLLEQAIDRTGHR